MTLKCILLLLLLKLHYLSWNATTGSAKISLISISRPFLITSGCFFCISHPQWEKNSPLFELWGSASVSLNLWWTLWSRTQSNIEFWNIKLFTFICPHIRNMDNIHYYDFDNVYLINFEELDNKLIFNTYLIQVI